MKNLNNEKIYDITQELFGCVVFPGDPAPQKSTLASMSEGDPYNLTAFSMCAHNGTHIDAPYHFVNDGKKIDELMMSSTVGWAYVADFEGVVSAEDAERIISNARKLSADAAKRILLKGRTTVSLEAAKVFAKQGILLLGNESQTVGPEDAPMAVHLVLLGADVVLLEGVRLSAVPEGVYWLSAAPLLLGRCEGSPCRALLVDFGA